MHDQPGIRDHGPSYADSYCRAAGSSRNLRPRWVIEVHCPEGAAPAIMAHLHRRWTETFEILQGSAACRRGAEERRLAAGESIVMPPNVPHVHPWNVDQGNGLQADETTSARRRRRRWRRWTIYSALMRRSMGLREGRIGKRGCREARCSSLRRDERSRSTGVSTSACQSHFKWL